MRWVGIVIASLWMGVAVSAAAQRPQQPQRPPEALTIDSVAGKDTYSAYCAPCHGRTGAGDGPVGPVLRTPPADLRMLSKKRGVFPRDEVIAFVTGSGRAITAHGTSDMPIWGTVFRMLDPSDVRVNLRLQNVVDYLESLQQSIAHVSRRR